MNSTKVFLKTDLFHQRKIYSKNDIHTGEKKTTPIVCNGKTPVQIKTIHGVFSFEVQRYRLNDEATIYFDSTEQFLQGYSSQRLQEYVSYYSNRMSYEEVEKLVARHQSQPILSDQGIAFY